ncbi:MAG: mechanosensitive ion channel [Candidatus Omnitrophica bacterium]|nr:mechanosensitive ion channel [Candidatus Omnitrophota bacterium]MBU1128289.1 mechanosensitive ion channel [Candidatus Omnitrophota bacterium]MBU1656910.1 mechanosensitive ion channel [Candidatus Omnitrophota bacterium]MBU1784044.1 mechanosensitive ion channel [Candidatus Omnitrophota bacterium]MBU1851039.1 mechanosensitive ion channel [Candidatus Omnitrophota bacterium]
MGNARRFSLVMFFCVISFLLISVKDVSYSQDAKEVDVKAVAIDQKDEIEKLEEKENQKKEEIKQKEEDLDQIQKEAQKANEEKIKAEGAVLLKQQEANVAKEKAEAVKKEAEVREDDVLLREAKRLEGEAEKIKEQADVEREALKMVEIQERLALQKLDANQKKIEELKEAIQGIKREKSLKRSWAEKLSVSGVSVVIGIALFFLLNFVIARLGKIFVKTNDIREDELSLRINTIARLLHWLGSFVIFGIVASMILETFGVSLGPLLAGAGIVGLAFGFGGQYLIRDLINGLFILIEGQYRVNDVVKINDMGGLVEDINLRITTLRDLAGRVIIIPNGEIKAVINYTRGYSQALLDVGVAYKENVDKVMEIIRQMGDEMRKDPYFGRLILADLEMFGVDDFSDSAVMIKFRIKTRPIKQWEVSREFKRRLKNKFDELGIEIPFPHRTLYWGTDKDNQRLKDSMERITK